MGERGGRGISSRRRVKMRRGESGVRERRRIVKAKYAAVYRIIRGAICAAAVAAPPRRRRRRPSVRPSVRPSPPPPPPLLLSGRRSAAVSIRARRVLHKSGRRRGRESLLKLYSSATKRPPDQSPPRGFSEFLQQRYRARYLSGRSGRVIERADRRAAPLLFLLSMYRDTTGRSLLSIRRTRRLSTDRPVEPTVARLFDRSIGKENRLRELTTLSARKNDSLFHGYRQRQRVGSNENKYPCPVPRRDRQAFR